MKGRLCLVLGVLIAAIASPSAQQPTFRASRDLVSIDVVVRDRSGGVVRGLTADDFEVREDGKPQEISTFTFQEINAQSVAAGNVNLLSGIEAQVAAGAGATAPVPPPPASRAELSPTDLAGRRLMMLLFDVSSMQPEDVQRAVDSAVTFVTEQMGPEDLVSVATVGSTLNILTDFTGDRTEVAAALATLGATEGTAVPEASASTIATDETAQSTDTTTDTSEFDNFNNDARLRALRVLADTLAPLEQKKAVIYFSAGMDRSGDDNLVEVRAATNAAVRANLSIYPVDSRGLQALPPGGDARQASRGGVGLFSGRNVSRQFDSLAASQDSLVSLAADTGGQAFTDSNDFGEAFTRVRRDISAYYLIGFSSTNTTEDGKFRRVQIRLKRDGNGLRVDARNGYYANRDFGHTNGGDREAQLRIELDAAVSATNLPVLVASGWFRVTPDRYYVPIAVAIPGSAVPVNGAEAVVDVMGQVRDEQGRQISRIRQTLKIPSAGGPTLEKQVLYQSGVTLPPGRFSVKIVVRENTTGSIGSFEAPLIVPELKQASLKMSSVVLSSQVQPWTGGRTDNPLVRDGVQLLPNLTHVVSASQKLYFYYEVYEAAAEDGATPLIRTSLAFYRGKVKVFETPVVERTMVDAPDRKASLFEFELPAGSLGTGLYTCQINIVDTVASKFSFPRLTLLVK